jgi:hypothetical protein
MVRGVLLVSWLSAQLGVVFGCTQEQAEDLNRLAGDRLVTLANAAIGKYAPNTVGDCAVVNQSQQPCRSVSEFPVRKTGKDWDLTVEYVTGLRSLSMKNMSLRCDPNSSSSNSSSSPPKRAWFAEIDGTFVDFSLMVDAKVNFPKVHKHELESVDNLTAHIVARIHCEGDSLRLELDPAPGSLTLSKIELDISIIHVDVSEAIVEALRSKLQSAIYTPPPQWIPFMRAVCSASTSEELFVV